MTEKTADEMVDDAKKRKEAGLDRSKNNRLAVMSTPQGREFVFELLDGACGLYSGSFAGEATHTAAFNEGQRSVGILVQRQMQADCPGNYLQMMSEAFERSRAQPSRHESNH